MTMSTKLESEFLFLLEGDISAPLQANENLLIFDIAQATIDGPKIKGEVVPPRGDWIRIMPNGNWRLDVRFTIRTDDGHFIYCSYTGVLRMDEGLAERIGAGESIPGEEMYFRSTPYFETTSEKYGWLNDIASVGRMASFGGGKARYEVFTIL
ncbi:MAG: hypothetical protein ACI8TX_003476 [Hyphomicrobiaceae bacterium]|jgi:hypothetical protein